MVKFTETESRGMADGGRGGAGGESVLDGGWISAWDDEEVPDTSGGDGRPAEQVHIIPLSCMLKNS